MSDDGEELRLPRTRNIKRVTVVSATSGSDSDSDGGLVASRAPRKRMRVVSDEDSDSSGSSVGRSGARRPGALPHLRDSDVASEDDSPRWNTPAAPATSSRPVSGSASDSSEGNSDKCSICLTRFSNQEVGTPQTCEHIFCLDCITEWSKNVNTCPVDRLTFESIVVRAHAGAHVLRTEPVSVVRPRSSSLDTVVLVDTTICEICGNTDDEERMLLCDECDLGYHMQCLTPPLTEIPIGEWYCPNCDSDFQDIDDLSEIDDLFSELSETDFFLTMGPRPSPLRQPRNVRRSNRRNENRTTNLSHYVRENNGLVSISSSSRESTSGTTSTHRTRKPRTNTGQTRRRKYRKRRTKTVIIEYEETQDGKRPILKKIKRKIKKRKVKKRVPRTAARRTHVRESVRAKLATFKLGHRQELTQVSNASSGVQDLYVRRQRAGIPTLSLLGNPNQLDYFSEEEHEVSEGASTAVALRSTSRLLSAHRQVRRKMVTVPSPPHASSAPDILSSILESQTLLHSKKSVFSVTPDGNVNIKVETRPDVQKKREKKHEDRLNLSKSSEGARQTPSYPGHSRSGGGGGGWGGGYRGNYHRERGTTGFGRGSYNEGDYPGGPLHRHGNHYQRNDTQHHEQTEPFTDYAQRGHRHLPPGEPQTDRNRRYSDSGRGYTYAGSQPYDATSRQPGPLHPHIPGSPYPLRPQIHQGGPPYQGGYPHQERTPHQGGPPQQGGSWRPYGMLPSLPRPSVPPFHRHSFGGFDDPLDMRTASDPPRVPACSPHSRPDTFVESRLPTVQLCRPLPDPPVFDFDTGTDLDKSEDERSDPDLVIDTDKYDPTEPTHDEDSGDETRNPAPFPPSVQTCALTRSVPLPPPPLPPELPQAGDVREVLSGLDVTVPSALLDSAVRQVLEEHRDLLAPPQDPTREPSDSDTDGDCPNFSIYSATSVHIANNTSALTNDKPRVTPQNDLEDLVQEDDDTPVSPVTSDTNPTTCLDVDVTSKPVKQPTLNRHYNFDISAKKKSDEYKEKVSKRCPITTNPRNPIKIKLTAPSLIKRPVSLYDDDEDEAEDLETSDPPPNVEEASDSRQQDSLANFSKSFIEMSMQQNIEATDRTVELFKPLEEIVINEKIDTKRNDHLKDEEYKDDNTNNLQSENEVIPTTGTDIQQDPDKESKQLNGHNELTVTPEHEISSEDSSGPDEQSPKNSPVPKIDALDTNGDQPEKMTESISETEDERSYTPCLDENKSKDTSLETDKDKGIEGLDTEMISEDEGNEMFSDEDRAPSEKTQTSIPTTAPVTTTNAEASAPVVKKQGKPDADTKKKKKKDSKKENKDRGKTKRKGDVTFKKLSKSGKERNYREREKQATERERRGSTASAERDKRKRKRKEKRKDLERYNVRTVVGEKRRKRKDAFGRDVSPQQRSRSPSLSSPRRSLTPRRRSTSPRRRSTPPRRRSISPRASPSPRRRSPTPRRRTPTPHRRLPTPRRRSPSPRHRSLTPRRRSPTPRRRSPTPVRCSSPPNVRVSLSPIARRRRSQSRGRPSPSPGRARRSRSPRSHSLRAASPCRRRSSPLRGRRPNSRPDRRSETRPDSRPEPRRRRDPERARKRRRSASGSRSPRPKSTKRKKAARSERATSRKRKSPRRRRVRRRSTGREPEPSPGPTAVQESSGPRIGSWSPATAELRPPSPCTPPPALELHDEAPRRRRESDRVRHRRQRDAGGASKEVFTSGDNILVSVSFKEQERTEDSERRTRRKERRRRKKRAPATEPESTTVAVRPVAIIDLERSPFRELTPSPRDVIVLSDSDGNERDPAATNEAAVSSAASPTQQQTPGGTAPPPADTSPAPGPEERGPTTPPDPPDSPDAYDPYEPTRSASGSPSPSSAPAQSPPRTTITLETAQKTNMSADEVIDRRPLSPIEKVMALLQSTCEVSPERPPQEPEPADTTTATTATVLPSLTSAVSVATTTPTAAPAPAAVPAAPAPAPPVRIVLPEAVRPQPPKLFLAKPSPIKSDPIKPMPKPSRPPPVPVLPALTAADSPYSPGSSDFGDLFSPPTSGRRDPFDLLIERATRRSTRNTHGSRNTHKSRSALAAAARVPVRLDRKQGKTQVGIKIDEENLKILDDLPSSAVEMQVKTKFLKKLNRQERVVEEVKLVLKPHYNKKHVTKDQYKDILRRAVPKICHNKSGEINPTKIQTLIEAYVKKIRKKNKLGLL